MEKLLLEIIEYYEEVLITEKMIEEYFNNSKEIKEEALRMSKETTKTYLECLYELNINYQEGE